MGVVVRVDHITSPPVSYALRSRYALIESTRSSNKTHTREENVALDIPISSTGESVRPSPDILNSWKEIARYLDRGIRTVQRWEGELGLPVRRPHGRGRSAVFAVKSEIDAWLLSRPREIDMTEVTVDGRVMTEVSLNSLHMLHVDARRLRADVVASRAELGETITRLVQTLSKMMQPV